MTLEEIINDDSLMVVEEANEKVRHQFYWLAEKVEELEKENSKLRAELTELKQEAHDKHWPLANACRNLLPTAPTNIEQVQLVVAKLSELRSELAATRKVLLEAVKAAYRKHHMNDDRIGWEELDNILFTALTETMGDEFRRWLDEIPPEPWQVRR